MVVSDTTTMQRANIISVSHIGLLKCLGIAKVGIIPDTTKYFCFYLVFSFRSPTQMEPTPHLEPSCSTIWEPEQRANSLSILFYFRNIMQPDGCRHRQTDAAPHRYCQHHAAKTANADTMQHHLGACQHHAACLYCSSIIVV